MHRNEDLHDEIMNAFRAYFKANQDWNNKGTRRAGMQARYWLSEIRRLARAQRKIIMDWRYEIDEQKQIKKAQKNKGTDAKDAN